MLTNYRSVWDAPSWQLFALITITKINSKTQTN